MCFKDNPKSQFKVKRFGAAGMWGRPLHNLGAAAALDLSLESSEEAEQKTFSFIWVQQPV